MSEFQQPAYRYQVGGGLSPTAPSYVFRPADDRLYQALKASEFCYVFNCRQMGKTSLRNQTMQRLMDEGYRCISVDLTTIGSGGISAAWYRAFANALHDAVAEQVNFDQWWVTHEELPPIRSLHLYFKEVLLGCLPNEQIVIFIDEIDTVLGLEFDASDFFALIRACLNLRGEDRAYNRLTFALFGVATPASLVRDPGAAPFNIGRDITLSGFEFERSQVLAEGLVGCVPNPEAVLWEILDWTGGQPFLTQKLCDLVQCWEELEIGELVAGEERAWVEELVRLCVIENWSFQDNPKHLRTIQERIFKKPHLIGRMLGVYQQILHAESVDADGSEEQLELRLSGLVVEGFGKLKVYNRIYQVVFDANWIEQEQVNLRSYANKLKRWIASGYQDESQLLQGEELLEALTKAKGKSLADEDYRFFAASQDLTQQEMQRSLSVAKAELSNVKQEIQVIRNEEQRTKQDLRKAKQDLSTFQKQLRWGFIAFSLAITSGVGIFVFLIQSANKKIEVANASTNELRKTLADFSKFLKKTQNPETLINKNNAIANFPDKKRIRIAVSVSLSSNPDIARAILRGVAQFQDQINKDGDGKGINGAMLEVVVVDDRNDPSLAVKIANDLVNDAKVLAVIGHSNSETSLAAAEIYQKAGLVMITPTSSADMLSDVGNYIFRTAPTMQAITSSLANYAVKTQTRKVAICYEPYETYSSSFSRELTFALVIRGIKIAPTICDFADPAFAPNTIIQNIKIQSVNAIVLVPTFNRIDRAIELAKANRGKFPLFGSPTLYNSEVLQARDSALNGLVIPLPWHSQAYSDHSFVKEARELWGGTVNWRTASSYDAAAAIATALQQNQTRSGIQQVLRSSNFIAQGAGESVRFDAQTGDKELTVRLVQLQPETKSLESGSTSGWTLLHE